MSNSRLLRITVPIAVLAATVLVWWLIVEIGDVPPYRFPSPVAVATTLVEDWPILGRALLVTLALTFAALLAAVIGGVLIAILISESRWAEIALYPYMVILQVMPVVAIAPILLATATPIPVTLLILSFIVAFFPILANTVQGLKSVDHNLLSLFDIQRATWWQRLRYLKLPSALPFFLTGLRTGGGLALIAAVVAEFAAGASGAGSGLAFRLFEASYRLNTDRAFAALILLGITGVAIFAVTGWISRRALRHWHESAVEREN